MRGIQLAGRGGDDVRPSVQVGRVLDDIVKAGLARGKRQGQIAAAERNFRQMIKAAGDGRPAFWRERVVGGEGVDEEVFIDRERFEVLPLGKAERKQG